MWAIFEKMMSSLRTQQNGIPIKNMFPGEELEHSMRVIDSIP